MTAPTRIKVLARSFPLSINTGTALLPVWTKVESLDNLTFTFGETDAPTNDFDSNGWESHLVAMRNLSISAAGQAALDPITQAPLPGQAAVEASARLVGPEAFQSYQVTRPGGATIGFTASATCTPFGGGTNDASKWTATFKVDGEPTYTPAV